MFSAQKIAAKASSGFREECDLLHSRKLARSDPASAPRERCNKLIPCYLQRLDRESTNIKCHLLLEFMFNQFIDLIAPTEGVIDSDRFTFKQKETHVHMLGFPADPRFFPTIGLLNSVRNAVAHTLTLDRQKIDKLIRINCDDPKDARGLSDVQRASALKQITKCMCWQMLGTLEAKHEIEWMGESDSAESGTPTDP